MATDWLDIGSRLASQDSLRIGSGLAQDWPIGTGLAKNLRIGTGLADWHWIGGLATDWQKIGGLAQDWRIGTGLAKNRPICTGLAPDWPIGNLNYIAIGNCSYKNLYWNKKSGLAWIGPNWLGLA